MALPMQRATPAQAQATHAKAHAAVVRHARFMRHVRRQLCGAFTTRTSSIAGGSGAAGTRGQNPAIIVQLLPAFQKLDAMISDDSFEVDVHHFKNMMREAGVTTLGDKELENLFIECAIATETDAESELGDLCDLSHDRSSAASPFAPETAKMGGIATSALSSQASRDVALNERMSEASSATLAPHSVGYVASPLYQRLLRTTADHGQLLLHLGLGTEHGHGAPGTNAASRGFHAAASGSTFSFSPEIEENRQAFFARARLDMAETLVVIRRMFGSHGKQVHDVIRRLRAGAPDPRKAPNEDHQNPWTRLEVFEYLVSLGLTHSEAFLLLEHSTFLSFSSSGDRGGIEPGAPGPHVTRRDPNAIAGVARLVSASAVRLDGPASATAAAANGAFDVAYLRAFLVERPMPEHVAMALLATKFAEAVADGQKEFSGTVGLKRFLALAVGGPGAARSISPHHPTPRSDVALHHAPAVSTGAGEAHRRSSLFLHDGPAGHGGDHGSRSVSPQPQPGAVRSASGKIGGAASGAGASDGTVGVAEKPTRVSPGRDSYYPSRSRSQSSAASVTATAQMDVFAFRQFMVAFGTGLPQGEVDLLFGFLVKRRAELDNAPPVSTQEAMSMPILAADVVSLFHDFFPHATEREKLLIVADAKAAIVDGPTSGAAVAAQTSHRGSGGGGGGGAAAAHTAAAFPALMTLYLALFDDSRVVVPSTADGSPLPPRRVVYLKEFTAALRAHGVTAVHLCDVDIEHLWNITQEPREIVNLLGGPLPVSRHDLLVKLWRRLEQASAADGQPNFGQSTRTGSAVPFQRVPRKNVLDAFVPEAAERRVVQRGEELTHALRNFLETVENDALHFPATAYDAGDQFNGRGHVDPFAGNPFSSTAPSTIGDDGAMSFRDFEFFWGAVGAAFPDEALFVMTVWQSFGMHRDGRNLVDVQRTLRRRSSANASSTAFGDAAPQPTAQSSAASRARLRASEKEQHDIGGERGGRGGGGGDASSDPAPRSARLPPTAGYTPSHDKSVDSAARRMSGRGRVPDSVAHVHHTSSNVFGGTSPGVRRSDLSGTAAERRKTHDRLAEETTDVGVGRSTPPKFRRARSPQPNTYGSTAAAESCVPLGNDYSFSRPHSRPGGASPSRTPPRSPRSAPRGFEDGEFGPPQPSPPLHAAGVATNANVGAAAVGAAPSSPSRHGRGVGAGTGASAAAALGGGNVSTYYPGGVSVGGGPVPHRRGSVRGESPAVASLDESFGSVTVSPRKNVTGRHHSLQSASLEAPLTPGRRKMSAPPTVVGSERPSGRARLGH